MGKLFSKLFSLPVIASWRGKFGKSGIIKRYSTGVFWTFIGNIIWRVLSTISTISVARILGPHSFGEYGMIQSTVGMFSTYAGLRLGTTATKYVAEYRNDNPEKAGRILKLTMLASLISSGLVATSLFVAAPYMAKHSFNRAELSTGLALGALLIFFLIYGNVKQYAIAGFENFRSIAMVNILRGGMTPLFCIPLAFFGGVEGALTGLILVAIVVLVRFKALLRQEQVKANLPQHIPLRDIKSEIPTLWKFSLPGFLAGVLIALMLWIGRIQLIGHENGFTELGIFEAANQWRMLILFLPVVLSHVVLPILSQTYGNESKAEFKATVSLQLQALSLITLPMVIFVIGFSKPLASIFGRQYSDAEMVIPVLMISVFFFAMNQSLRQVFDGAGKPWKNFGMYLIWALVYFLGCVKLIPGLGAIGFAAAQLIAEIVLLLIQVLYLDLFLVPGTLRRHLGLFIYSILLLSASYSVYVRFSGPEFLFFISAFLLLGMMPVFLKLRALWIK